MTIISDIPATAPAANWYLKGNGGESITPSLFFVCIFDIIATRVCWQLLDEQVNLFVQELHHPSHYHPAHPQNHPTCYIPQSILAHLPHHHLTPTNPHETFRKNINLASLEHSIQHARIQPSIIAIWNHAAKQRMKGNAFERVFVGHTWG